MGWIIRGIASVLLELILDLFVVMSGVLNGLMLDFGESGNKILEIFGKDTFNEYFNLFALTGLALALGITVFKLIQTMLGPISDGEDPGPLAIRFIIATTGVLTSYHIFETFQKAISIIYEAFLDNATEQVVFAANANAFFSSKTIEEMFGNPAKGSVTETIVNTFDINSALICVIIVLFTCFMIGANYIKLIFESIERYVTLAFLYYTSPLAFAMLASNGTKRIFGAWMQMVISEVILLCLNLFFISTFMVGFSRLDVPNIGELHNYLLTTFILTAWLILGQKADEHLRSLGFATAQTGRGLGVALLGSALGAATIAGGAARLGKGIKGSVSASREAALAGKAQMEKRNTPEYKQGEEALQKLNKGTDISPAEASSVINTQGKFDGDKARQLANAATEGKADKMFDPNKFNTSIDNGKVTFTDKDGKTKPVTMSDRHKPGDINMGNGFYIPPTQDASERITRTEAALHNAEASTIDRHGDHIDSFNADGRTYVSLAGIDHKNAMEIAESYKATISDDGNFMSMDEHMMGEKGKGSKMIDSLINAREFKA